VKTPVELKLAVERPEERLFLNRQNGPLKRGIAMPHYKYLIIGGGMTADAAAKGIREVDTAGSIGVTSMEADPPYDRPPLTKGLWEDKPLASIWRHTEREEVELHLGRRVEALDIQGKCAVDDQRNAYTCEKLLLATGGGPGGYLLARIRSFTIALWPIIDGFVR
jgi:hypothetical protein